jgi:hypothetical protein
MLKINKMDEINEMEEINTMCKMKESEYFHFDENEKCDEFVELLQISNIFFTHKCCSGKGCGIKIEDLDASNIIYSNFKQNVKPMDKRIEPDECIVCWSKTNTITKCNHYLCNECFGNLSPSLSLSSISKTCPYCRQSL